MAILLTGAGGMMGSHLAELLVLNGDNVVATYLNPTIDMATVDQNVSFSQLDVCNRQAVFSIIDDIRPQEIYHLAAQSLPVVSWADPWGTFRVNVEGTINVFEAILAVRKHDPSYCPIVVIACSSAEYGASMTPERVPITEEAPLLPMHPYGVSKVAQDLLGLQYWMNNGVRCIRARIFNCTGPRKRNDVVSDFARSIVNNLDHGIPLIHGNLKTRRAIIDVRDMVNALVALARNGKSGLAYNICSDSVVQISDIIEMYFDILGRRLDMRLDPSLLRPSDEPVIFGDTSLIRQDTGWSPKISLRKTLEDVLNFELNFRTTKASD